MTHHATLPDYLALLSTYFPERNIEGSSASIADGILMWVVLIAGFLYVMLISSAIAQKNKDESTVLRYMRSLLLLFAFLALPVYLVFHSNSLLGALLIILFFFALLWFSARFMFKQKDR